MIAITGVLMKLENSLAFKKVTQQKQINSSVFDCVFRGTQKQTSYTLLSSGSELWLLSLKKSGVPMVLWTYECHALLLVTCKMDHDV